VPSFATPSMNPQIAAELHLTVAGIKTDLRALFHAFGIVELPQPRSAASWWLLRSPAASSLAGICRSRVIEVQPMGA
jgi:hypothetical protein